MSQATNKPKVKVLYQRLGDTWYAFTAVGEEIFVGKVPLSQSAKAAKEASPTGKKENGRPVKKTSQAA